MSNINLRGPNWPVNGTIYTQWGAFPVVKGVASVPDDVAQRWLRADRSLRVAGQPAASAPSTPLDMGVETLCLRPAAPPPPPPPVAPPVLEPAPVEGPPASEPEIPAVVESGPPASKGADPDVQPQPASEPETSQPVPQRARRTRRRKTT